MQNKLDFQLITNQPIYEPLLKAIEAITSGWPVTGDVKKQVEQFKAATGLDGKTLAAFAAKVQVNRSFWKSYLRDQERTDKLDC